MATDTTIVRASLGSDEDEEEERDELRRVTSLCRDAVRRLLRHDESSSENTRALMEATEELVRVAWQERVFWVDSDRHLAEQIRKTEELRKRCIDATRDLDVVRGYLLAADDGDTGEHPLHA